MALLPSNEDGESEINLRALRKHAGMTLKELAGNIGYSVSHLSNVERGRKRAARGLVQTYKNLIPQVERGRRPLPTQTTPPTARQWDGCGEDDFGTRLMRLRLENGLSLLQLSLRTNISRSHLGNLETGRKRPSQQVAETCAAAFQVGGDALAQLAEAAHASTGTTSDQSVLGCGDLWAAGEPEQLLISSTADLSEQRAAGQHARPQELIPHLVHGACRLPEVAAETRGSVRIDLLMLAARYAEFTGWMFQESGDDSAADQWTQTAVRWAGLAGDHDMAVYAWERRALGALYDGDGRRTVELAAQGGSDRQASTRVVGLAVRREAQGHALAGDKDAYERALDKSRELIIRGPAPYPRGVSWGPNTITDSSVFVEASCLVDLGFHRQAVELFMTEEADRTRALPPRTRVRFGVRESMALLGIGEIGRACDLLEALLPHIARVDSATIRRDLRRAVQTLNRHRRQPRVKNLMPNLYNVLRPC